MEKHHHKEELKSEKAASKPKSSTTDYKLVGVLAVAIIVIIGVIYMVTNNSANAASSTLVVAVGDNVSVSYVGTFTNGTVFDSTAAHGGAPLTFTVGSGQLIQGFDLGVVGMKVNQTKQITLPPAQAYGDINPAMIIQVPIAQFGNQTIENGMIVTQTSQDGSQQQQGVVTAVNATNVTVDFNSPLAGQTLIFNITVLSIKKG